ncbi:MAG: carboxypeptidase regulatory-like domain-containing protein [Bryobacterales bacterium]|nr:carboxypeptidase regulatory-like domain-containing protein [Bryobacterales bacterium]
MRLRNLALVVWAGALLWGQADANKGQIVGIVYDPKQAVVPGATVRIKNLGTGFTRELKTNEFGQFRAVALDPGTYELVAESSGFAPTTLSGIELNVGSTVNLNVILQLSTTVVTVEVADTMISTTLPAASTVITSNVIRNLPINGRRFQDFALLTPTVQVEPQRGQLSFAGQKGINSNVMVDGADYNQPFFGGIRGGERANLIFTVPQSAVQEFQIIATGYSAEYGRSTGGVLNAITKSGTNEYHGEVYYNLRHKELGRKTPFGLQSLETRHQFGGAAGGPVRRDRMFWFAAVERQDSRTPRYVLFPLLRGLAETNDNREALQHFRSLETPFTQTNDAIALLARGDYQFSAGHRLTLRYNFSDGVALNSTTTGTRIEPSIDRALTNNGTEKDRTHTGGIQFTSLLGPATVNDLRFQSSYEIRPREANLPTGPEVAAVMGRFGTVNFLPTVQDDMRIQINDGLSLIRGRHTLKIGADYNRLGTFQRFGFNQFGAFAISGTDVQRHLDILSVGGAVANRFDDRAVTYRRQIGNLLVDYAVHQFALYGQDSWRVTPTLTLDLGFRWEGQWNPTPQANNTSLIERVRNVVFPLGKKFDPTVIRDNTKQFMPRFGFAWSPSTTRRMVVRGHTGLFYASTPMLLLAGPMNNFREPPGDVSIQLPRSGSTVYRDLLAVGVDLNTFPLDKLPLLDVETVRRAAGGGAVDPFAGANLLSWAADYNNPRSYQAGLGYEMELARNLVAGVQLNYVNTVHIQRNRDFNLPAPTLRPGDLSQRPFFGLRSGTRRPVPSLGAIWVRETSARSMYRGMTFSSQYRSGRLQFGAFYTVSQTFSDDDQERDATGFRHDNSFNLRPEYGYSDLDRRHQFTGYAVASLPFGIELSSVFRAVSGRPIDPRTGADTNEDLAANDRAYQAPGVPYRRNSFRDRAISNVDLRFLKTIPLPSERFKLEFSCEMFNLFDIDNVVFGSANTIYGLGVDPATGATLSPRCQAPPDGCWMRLRLPDGRYDPNNLQVGNPFQAQIGLRLTF